MTSSTERAHLSPEFILRKSKAMNTQRSSFKLGGWIGGGRGSTAREEIL
jgi:hypothetical protein